jgi:hypothetical protein
MQNEAPVLHVRTIAIRQVVVEPLDRSVLPKLLLQETPTELRDDEFDSTPALHERRECADGEQCPTGSSNGECDGRTWTHDVQPTYNETAVTRKNRMPT